MDRHALDRQVPALNLDAAPTHTSGLGTPDSGLEADEREAQGWQRTRGQADEDVHVVRAGWLGVEEDRRGAADGTVGHDAAVPHLCRDEEHILQR